MPNTLPLPPTRLVGRGRQLDELIELTGRERIVTVLGTGGVGKTRLALELAHRLLPRFPAGVWPVDLSALQSGDVVEAEVVARLGVTRGSADPVRLVAEQLADRQALLVLDNCEHLIQSVAPLAARLAGACRGLSLLCTSREPLGIAGETTYLLGPLDSDESAVELFVDRARAADPGFVPAAPDGPILAELCARIDRIPLAIELAAPWIRLFTPAELLPRVAARFDRLTAERRDRPPRQRSMHATVEWSYRLLTPPQQLLFRRLGVFAGTFDLDAAEQVCGTAPLTHDDIATLLAALRERSLVTVERRGTGSRYRLLETLRQFTAEGREPARHTIYFRDRAERIDAQRLRTGADTQIADLAADADNYRAALRWSAEHEPETALRLAAALEGLWMIRSVAEGRRWLRQALDLQPAPTRHRARALMVLPLVVAAGPTDLEESLGIYRSLGDDVGADLAQLAMSLAAFFDGDLAEAARRSDLTSSHPLVRARAACYRGAALAFTPRRLDEARHLLREAIDRSGAIEDGWGHGLALTMLGFAELRAGQRRSAGERLRAALAGDLRGGVTAAAVGGLGQLRADDDPRAALTLLEAADAVRERAGVPRFPAPIERHLTEVRDTAGRRVAVPIAERCRQRARRLTTGEILDLAREGTTPTPALTNRQQEVALLVADGLSNREIATHLHLSVRTVETHVEHVLSALGLHRRIELAGWIRDSGLK